MAAIGKQIWRLLTSKTFLWKLLTSSSNVWSNLLSIRRVFKSFFRYQVGNEKNFSSWFDLWVEGKVLVDIFPDINIKEADIKKHAVISDVWRNGVWFLPDPLNEITLRAWDEVREIDGNLHRKDKIIWNPSPSGNYSMKSAWNEIRRKG